MEGLRKEFPMRFKLKITPPTATAQQKGERVVGGYIHHYKKKNVAQAEAILRDALLPYVPEEPITDKPISMCTVWMFPYPKSAKKHEPGWYRRKITRPDTDNLNKLLKDVMTDMGFWKDDALICTELIMKVYSDEPGILIDYYEPDVDVDGGWWISDEKD
jgi:Holliday junction resolvase RusA-like endonuclease